jgi:hypothetical protein
MTYVAAFRAYSWDEDIETIAKRFFANCPGGRHVVLLDETKGPIDIGPYEKISHTIDTSEYQLKAYPKDFYSLWFNCDYGIYILRARMPGYDYYILSESDLAVNLCLDPVIEDVRRKQIDFVARDFCPAEPEWGFYPNASKAFRNPWKVYLFFMIVSARAADFLHEKRVDFAERFDQGEVTGWPFCEAWVPSTLREHDGMRLADIEDYALVDNLRYRPRVSLNDPAANKPGSLVHSVIGPTNIVSVLIDEYGAEEYFRPQSRMRWILRHDPLDAVLAAVRAAFLRNNDGRYLYLLEVLKRQIDGEESCFDIALLKPALSSSVSLWSHHYTADRDAAGANAIDISPDYGFHTHKENNPWWQVSLLGSFRINEIRIVNRPKLELRFTRFKIDSSIDGENWDCRYKKDDDIVVSSQVEEPWVQKFSPAFSACFVRITLLGEDCLHLRRVQVFGHEAR